MTTTQPCCPKCGASSGYYERRRVTLEQHIDFEGEPTACEILERGRSVKRQHCSDCRKDITAYVASLALTSVWSKI